MWGACDFFFIFMWPKNTAVPTETLTEKKTRVLIYFWLFICKTIFPRVPYWRITSHITDVHFNNASLYVELSNEIWTNHWKISRPLSRMFYGVFYAGFWWSTTKFPKRGIILIIFRLIFGSCLIIHGVESLLGLSQLINHNELLDQRRAFVELSHKFAGLRTPFCTPVSSSYPAEFPSSFSLARRFIIRTCRRTLCFSQPFVCATFDLDFKCWTILQKIYLFHFQRLWL